MLKFKNKNPVLPKEVYNPDDTREKYNVKQSTNAFMEIAPIIKLTIRMLAIIHTYRSEHARTKTRHN